MSSSPPTTTKTSGFAPGARPSMASLTLFEPRATEVFKPAMVIRKKPAEDSMQCMQGLICKPLQALDTSRKAAEQVAGRADYSPNHVRRGD